MIEVDFKKTTRKTIRCEVYNVGEISWFSVAQLVETAYSKSIIKGLTKSLRLVLPGQGLVGGSDTKTR